MRLCVIASSRFPIAEPFAGGLEAWTHALVGELGARGHEVSLFAAPGSDPALPARAVEAAQFLPSPTALADVNAPSRQWVQEHHAYLDLMLGLSERAARGELDLVHNSSLHHLPLAMAHTLAVPMVTTLHTPPVAWLESAAAMRREPGTFVAVSQSTAHEWRDVVPAVVIHNGVDVHKFLPGFGGGPAVWSGRLVAEKAPHEAIAAARIAGVGLVLAGPLPEPAWFDAEVRPLLGGDIEYAGHLRRGELAELLGAASVAVVTPAWEEPYGLVAAEAMACGTPVAAYARGALPELVPESAGRLAPGGDVPALARAITEAAGCDRRAVREHALQHCSLTRMVDDYERLYASLLERRAA